MQSHSSPSWEECEGFYGERGRSERANIKPAMKPKTAAIRANFTISPISFKTTNSTTATISAMTNSNVRMKIP
jgi:hypothetical protein